jgi:GNAT superfamily N-acetyltransferase
MRAFFSTPRTDRKTGGISPGAAGSESDARYASTTLDTEVFRFFANLFALDTTAGSTLRVSLDTHTYCNKRLYVCKKRRSRVRESAENRHMPPVTLRSARPEDIPSILSLLRELAEYEHKLAKVCIDETLLARYVFGPEACAEVLLAELDGAPAGYALFFPHFASFGGRPWLYLEDLYVQPRARGQGGGRAIMARLARIAGERGWAGMAWEVLEWNQPAFAFYGRLGAGRSGGNVSMELSGPALEGLAREAS